MNSSSTTFKRSDGAAAARVPSTHPDTAEVGVKPNPQPHFRKRGTVQVEGILRTAHDLASCENWVCARVAWRGVNN